MKYEQAKAQLQHALKHQKTISVPKLNKLLQSMNISFKPSESVLKEKQDFDLSQRYQKYIEDLEKENKGLKRFYDYWSELYGKGLEIAYWHMNGDLEPFDSFFDNAEEELESDN